MRKYENFCAALNNLMDIEHYHEPYDNVTIFLRFNGQQILFRNDLQKILWRNCGNS